MTLTVDTVVAAPVVNPVAANTKAAPVVSGTAEANASVTLTATSVDGATVKTFTTTANVSGVWRIDTGAGSGSGVNSPLTADKAYNMRAKQLDVAGNESGLSATQTVNYDVTVAAPTVAQDTSAQAPIFTLTGTGEAGATLKVFEGGSLIGSTTVAANGSWTVNVSSPLSAGLHNFTAQQTDLADNLSATTAFSRTVVTSTLSAPQLTVDSDKGTLADNMTNVSTPVLTGSNATANAVVEVWEGGSKLGTAKANATGVWTLGISTPWLDGTHHVVVKELDSAGTVSRTSGTAAIVIDTQAAAFPSKPMLDAAGDSGTVGDGITNLTAQVLTGTAEALSKVELWDNGSLVATGQADSTGNWRISTPASAGSHSYTARQTDAAGNVSVVSAATALTVDTSAAAPTLSLGGIAVGSNPFVSGTAEALASVTVTYDGGGQVTVQADAQGNWRAQLPLAPISTSTYNLSVVQTDLAGNTSAASTGNLTISQAQTATPLVPTTLAAPVLTSGQDTGVSSVVGSTSDGVSSVTKPLLSGSGAQSNATVQLWANGIQVASTTAKADGGYNFEITDYIQGLSEGVQRLTVRQVVSTGGVSVSSIDSAAVSWTVDSVANASTPVLELTSQYATNAEGLVYANTASPTLSGSTEAGVKVEVYDNGALWQTVTADASGRWVLTAAALLNPASGTAHTITTVVTDVTGNVSGRSSALNFTLLTTAPTAPVASILAGGDSGISSTDGMTNITTQTITGTVNLVAGLDAPTVLVYDNGQLMGSVRADATGAWSFTATGLTTGGHVLTVRAKDVAGNLSAATLVTSLTVDTTAPTALTVNLVNGEDTGTSASDGLTNKTRPQVSGTAEAAATVELYVDGILAATTLADAGTGAFSLQPTQAISQGYHALTLVQVDAAGNRSAVSSIKPINVDSVIGAVTNLSLVASDVVYTSAGEFVTNKPKPTVKGFGEAGASVTIYSDSNAFGTTTVGADGQWSITLTADLSASNSLTATQTDAAGNTSAASAALKVAYSATASLPTVALQTASDTGVQGDGITSSTRPFLVGAGADNGDSIELYNSDGLVIGSATADDAGNWAVRPRSVLADGTYNFTVKNATQSGATLGQLKVQVLSQAGAAPTQLALAADTDSGDIGDRLTRVVTPVIEGTGAEPGATVRIMEGNQLWGIGQADSAGKWRVQTFALSDGAHSLTAVQINAAGVVSEASAPLDIQIDSQVATLAAPRLLAADDSGLVGDGVTNKTSVTLSGSGAEAQAWVDIYSGSVSLKRVQALADGSWTAVLSGLAAASLTLTARQTDAAGNMSSASAALSLEVDTRVAAPTLALDTGSSSSLSQPGYTMLTQPTFTGTAEKGATVKVYDDSLLMGTTVADSDGKWRLTSTVSLGLGRHSNVSAVQTDVAGNMSAGSPSLVLTVMPDVRVGMNFTAPVNWILSVGATDLNGDGQVDLWYGNEQDDRTDGSVYLLNNGSSFVDAFKLSKGVNNLKNGGQAQLDFNGDGRIDNLILANWMSSSALPLAAYRVNRAGLGTDVNASNFAEVQNAADAIPAASLWQASSSERSRLSALGDVNGDGELDFVSTVAAGSNHPKSTAMLSTSAGIWRQAKDPLPAQYNDGGMQWADVNNDGVLDAIVVPQPGYGVSSSNGYQSNTLRVLLGDGQGGYQLSANHSAFATASPGALLADLNGDGKLDVVGSTGQVLWGQGDGTFRMQSLGLSGSFTGGKTPMVADVNADGKLDLAYYNASGQWVLSLADASGQLSSYNSAAALGWDSASTAGAVAFRSGVFADFNNDRALDWASLGDFAIRGSGTGLYLNNTVVAENTYLKVMVTNDRGGLNAYGALVSLYDSATGTLVATRPVSQSGDSVLSVGATYGADFFGLDPAKSYDVVVVYPGSDRQVTVLTGKRGLGIAGIKASALNQVLDSSLTAVTPGGKDVVWVAKEDRSTSSNGGYWQGTGLADQMVGDKGADVFKPNGARIDEAGDLLSGGGGKDRFVFDVKAVLNTGATITDFTATAGTDADSIDIGALLTTLGYTGARTATGVADWVKLSDVAGKTTLQLDAHTGAGGAASGYVDLVTLNGVTGMSLGQLVSGGFVHLGGLKLSGVVADQTVTEALSQAGVQLAASATLSAEGGQWAAGFQAGKLVVSLEAATVDDSIGFSNVNSVTYDAASRAVKIGSVQVATVDSTDNGVGAVGKLALSFDFSAAGSSYTTDAQQAAAVQAVMQSLKLTSSTHAPSALDRAITFTLTDALGDAVDIYSGLRITPVADSATLNGVKYITGTESIETLTGTSANETIIGYNGVPTVGTPTYGQGDTLSGGGGNDSFKWLSLQLMNSDAVDKITDFGLKGGSGAGQGADEADVLDLSALLKGYNAGSSISDFIQAVNLNGKVQVQADFDGKANGSAFEKTWFMTLDNLSVNANNELLANNATVAATAPGLTGNVTIDTLVQQMMEDSQFKVL
jgi:hypothetical protein